MPKPGELLRKVVSAWHALSPGRTPKSEDVAVLFRLIQDLGERGQTPREIATFCIRVYEAFADKFTLDGEPLTLREFIQANDFTQEELTEILTLEQGRVMMFGGGAAPLFRLRRAKKR